MTPRRRLWLLVIATYIAARLLARALVMGTWALDGAFLAQLVVVPVFQVMTLEVAVRLFWKGRL